MAAYWRSSVLRHRRASLQRWTATWGREDILLAVLDPVEDGPRHGLRGGLGYVKAPGHVGVGGAGQDGVHADAASGQDGTQRLGQGGRPAAFEIE